MKRRGKAKKPVYDIGMTILPEIVEDVGGVDPRGASKKRPSKRKHGKSKKKQG